MDVLMHWYTGYGYIISKIKWWVKNEIRLVNILSSTSQQQVEQKFCTEPRLLGHNSSNNKCKTYHSAGLYNHFLNHNNEQTSTTSSVNKIIVLDVLL